MPTPVKFVVQSFCFLAALALGACASSASQSTNPDGVSANADQAPAEQGANEGSAGAGEKSSCSGKSKPCACKKSTCSCKKGKGHHKDKSKCPMKVPNTVVTAVETEQGSSLVFKTDAANVAELQKRIQGKAEKMAAHRAKHAGSEDKGGYHGPKHPKATVTAENTADGAKLVFVPENPAELQGLRDHVAKKAEKMNSGACWKKKQENAGTMTTHPAPEAAPAPETAPAPAATPEPSAAQ